MISATDQYLWRGGVSHAVTRVRGLALSIGGRMEGVPVRDAFGSSDGFRRPGYVISMEPALIYARGRFDLNVSGPGRWNEIANAASPISPMEPVAPPSLIAR